MRFCALIFALLWAAALLAGCAGGGLSLPSGPGLPDVAAITPKLAPADAPRPVGAPTEIYTRVARGILTCWFGASGPLKPGYIYNAEAEPPSKGGGSVISIHQRDRTAADPRSIRAWRLAVVPAPEGTTVDIENFRLPPEWAEPLGRDARRWAAGEEGCGEGPVPGAGDANAAAAVAPPATGGKTTAKAAAAVKPTAQKPR